MKIDKVIFGVDDNPLYQNFWPIQSKIIKKLLNAQPVLFHITNEDSDFYDDGNGIVKKINSKISFFVMNGSVNLIKLFNLISFKSPTFFCRTFFVTFLSKRLPNEKSL